MMDKRLVFILRFVSGEFGEMRLRLKLFVAGIALMLLAFFLLACIDFFLEGLGIARNLP